MIARSTLKPWLEVLAFAGLVYALGVGYNLAYRGAITSASWSESLALTGGILIGLSFALSGLTYFFDFLDPQLHYRKQLGLVGYYLALLYAITLVFRFPDRYSLSALTSHPPTIDVVTGLGAMAIFSFMAIISGNWAIKLLGQRWRTYLRLGYIAYALLVIRAIDVQYSTWVQWVTRLDTLPPPRLLLSIFAIGVISLRIALEISLRRKKRSATN